MVAPLPRLPVADLILPAQRHRRSLKDALPFLVSLLLHAVVIVVGVATIGVVRHALTAEKAQVTIPDLADVSGANDGSGVPFPALAPDDPRRPPSQDTVIDPPDAKGLNDRQGHELDRALAGAGTSAEADAALAVGAARPSGGAGAFLGGTSAGDGGPAAPFGVPGGGTIGLPGNGLFPIAPLGARRIAFVCDASGSMLPTFDTLRVEIRRAVDRLQPPRQSLGLIFFRENASTSLDRQLVLATPENKRRAFEFLDKVAPSGTTDPIPGLTLAFQQQPDVIYLLTDGEFPDNAAVVDTINKLNASRKVKVNTILFAGSKSDAEQDTPFRQLLQKIATDNGGVFKAADATSLR